MGFSWPLGDSDIGGSFALDLCTPSFDSPIDLTDSDCWKNIFPLASDQPTLTGTSMTGEIDETFNTASGFGFTRPFSFSTYFDENSDPVASGAPCQPALCDSGIQLDFDWSIALQVLDLSGNVQISVEGTVFAEIVEVDNAGEFVSAFDDYEQAEVVCDSIGGGAACPGGSVTSVSTSGSGSVSFSAGTIPQGNFVGTELLLDIDITLSGSGSGRLIATMQLSNIAWSLI